MRSGLKKKSTHVEFEPLSVGSNRNLCCAPLDKRLWWILLPALLGVAAAVFYFKFKSKKVHGDAGMKPLNLDPASSTAEHGFKWSTFLCLSSTDTMDTGTEK